MGVVRPDGRGPIGRRLNRPQQTVPVTAENRESPGRFRQRIHLKDQKD